jgi:hypothetical protein
MKNNHFFAVISLSLVFLMTACGGGTSAPPPPPGVLSGTVTSGNPATALPGVSVLVFDAGTNAPAAASVLTDASGKYSYSLTAGSYYVKLYKQGYDPVPASTLLTSVPVTVSSGATSTNNVLMTASAQTNVGWITGKVSNGSAGMPGVLVAAEISGVAYTSFTDSSGNYAIYNVPAAIYTVKAYLKGYSFTSSAATVTANTATTANLSVAVNATATVPVTFNLIAQTGVTKPAQMVVSLVHPLTRETIPGLSLSQSFANSMSYSFSGVADGDYFVRATYANDTIVVDPDYIVKFGEPSVTVTSAMPNPNPVQITATGAVGLTSPTNALSSTVPVQVTGTTPTFTWAAYSSTTDYVIEVMDAATGTVIWGGFSGTGAATMKNIVIPSSQTSIAYNSDSLASALLVVGKTYRWRIYASKDDNNSATGWSLISMSEDQMGLITIQ